VKKLWLNDKDLKCVILCAGRGTRILPHSEDVPKAMLELNNQPILYYVIDYWKQFTNDFIFVVGYKKEQVIDYVKKLPIYSTFVEQKKLRGIADAVNHVKDYVSGNFILVLGDCICEGKFNFPANMEMGVGVWETSNLEDIKRSYSIEITNDVINKVVEKPKEIPNNLCGMGFYFFNSKVFDYIKITPPSKLRNEIEITDVIQNMINGGETIKPIFFNGNYFNITFPEDIVNVEKYYFSEK
jgi:dTDP-glucose pyrophosphorylase